MSTIYHKLVERINSHRGIPLPVTELYFKIKKYLPSKPVILEAGAHMGFDTYGLAKIWPGGIIHAFEPVPDVFDSLVGRVKNFRNVKTYNVALGKENGNIEMYVSGGASSASSSILKPTAHLNLFPSVTFDNKIVVPLIKLADWAHKEKIPKIDLLWLDMQGYEVYALEGAGNLLQDVSVIYTELCKSELYSGLVTQNNYIEFLREAEFELISLAGDSEVSEGIFINTNAIKRRKPV